MSWKSSRDIPDLDRIPSFQPRQADKTNYNHLRSFSDLDVAGVIHNKYSTFDPLKAWSIDSRDLLLLLDQGNQGNMLLPML
jgi:hypothetical protein